MIPEKVINSVSSSVHPLVFEIDHTDYPYSMRGTVFIVGFKKRVFVITARHNLTPEDMSPICVFPNDSSQQIIPLKDIFFVPRRLVDDDFTDIAVIEVNLRDISNEEVINSKIIDIDRASGDWLPNSSIVEL